MSNERTPLELFDRGEFVAIYDGWDELLHHTGTRIEDWRHVSYNTWQRRGSPDICLKAVPVKV